MEFAMYIVCIAAVILNIVYAFLKFRDTEKSCKKLRIGAIGALGIMAVFAVMDLAGVFETGGLENLAVYSIIFGGIAFLGAELIKKVPERIIRGAKFAVKAAVICGFIELFIFNFNSNHLIGGDYTAMELPTSEAVSENFDPSTSSNMTAGGMTFEFKDINEPVGTVTIEAKSSTAAVVNAWIDMSDESNSGYRWGVANAQIIKDNERSETIPCNFTGKVSNLRFSFNAAEGETITVERIFLNIPITISFSFIRYLVMFLGAMAAYLMIASPLFKKELKDNKLAVRIGAYAMTGVFILTALFLTNGFRYQDPEHSLKKDFKMEVGNQMTQELVDAFEKGQSELIYEPTPELLALENPYDWSQRDGIEYSWDHLLFEDKYYSYYGIAPVLLLFLPYHMITDYYFPSAWAVFIFGAIGIFFMTKFYMAFSFKFFPKIRSSLIVLGLFIMQLVTGIWFCFNVPNFYEIAQTSGFACVTAGAFLLISSNVIGDGKIKNWRLTLSSVMLALGVLCRPTLAIYCVAALLFIYAGFRKKKSLTGGEKKKLTYYLPYFLCALLPFVVIGGVQMLYNYERFGSVMDFGIQYSLTINDFTVSEYHTHFVLIGFFNYLFALPNWTETFPFINCSEVKTFMPQGYYFVATASAIGLLWKALPVFAYGWGKRAYGITKNENKRLYSVLLAATCVIAPAIIIFSIWESGYGARYCVDFAWQILLGALCIGFIVFSNSSEAVRRILNKLMVLAAGICLVFTFGQTYNWFLEGGLSTDWNAMMLSFARLFEFWR